MPSAPGYVRDYKQEYKTARRRGEVDAGPNGKNAMRKKARRKLEKQGKVKPFDGKDVDHANGNTKDNSAGNLRVRSASANRSLNRKANASKYNPHKKYDSIGASRPPTQKKFKK